MIRLKKILFPTDFSDCSRRAQEYACALAEQFQADLHLLHVLQDIVPYISNGGQILALSDYFIEEQQAAEKALKQLLPAEWPRGESVVRTIRRGSPFLEIERYAKDNEIDLIVLGTHGRGALLHMLMGSVAERVVRKSPCPVLTVHPQDHEFIES